MKSIESVDKQATKLLEEGKESVCVDPEIMEGILTEMQAEMETLTRLANEENDGGDEIEPSWNDQHPESQLVKLQSYFDNLGNHLAKLSYDTSDTLDCVNEKLIKIQVRLS